MLTEENLLSKVKFVSKEISMENLLGLYKRVQGGNKGAWLEKLERVVEYIRVNNKLPPGSSKDPVIK